MMMTTKNMMKMTKIMKMMMMKMTKIMRMVKMTNIMKMTKIMKMTIMQQRLNPNLEPWSTIPQLNMMTTDISGFAGFTGT